MAEIGVCFLMSFAGTKANEAKFDAAYAKAWVQKLRNDPKFVITAATRANKVMDYILSVPNGQTVDEALLAETVAA